MINGLTKKKKKNKGSKGFEGVSKLPDFTAPFKKRAEGMKAPLTIDTGIYWWVWGWDGNRRALFGPFATEKECYSRGYEKLQTDFEVIALRTRNVSEASRQLHYRVLDDTSNLSEAMRRFRRKKSLGKGHTT